MGTIVCQVCNRTIDHFEDEKVTTLYAHCNHCNGGGKEEEEM